jgi:hypothetical protein
MDTECFLYSKQQCVKCCEECQSSGKNCIVPDPWAFRAAMTKKLYAYRSLNIVHAEEEGNEIHMESRSASGSKGQKVSGRERRRQSEALEQVRHTVLYSLTCKSSPSESHSLGRTNDWNLAHKSMKVPIRVQ